MGRIIVTYQGCGDIEEADRKIIGALEQIGAVSTGSGMMMDGFHKRDLTFNYDTPSQTEERAMKSEAKKNREGSMSDTCEAFNEWYYREFPEGCAAREIPYLKAYLFDAWRTALAQGEPC